MDAAFLEQLQQWHESCNFSSIISAIEEVPEANRDDELIGQLARALGNAGQYDAAIAALEQIRERCEDQALWQYRMGCSQFYKKEFAIALRYFEKVLALDPDDEDAVGMVARCKREISWRGARNDLQAEKQDTNDSLSIKKWNTRPINDIPEDS